MSPDGLNPELARNPFKPFRIIMTDGKTYDIRHPDFIWIQVEDAYIGTATMAQADLWERYHLVDVYHITRIEPLPSSPPPTVPNANGPQ